jgi:hypothetical protein
LVAPSNTAIASAVGALALYVAVEPTVPASVALTGTSAPLWQPEQAVVLVGYAIAAGATAATSANAATKAMGNPNIRFFTVDLRVSLAGGRSAERNQPFGLAQFRP